MLFAAMLFASFVFLLERPMEMMSRSSLECQGKIQFRSAIVLNGLARKFDYLPKHIMKYRHNETAERNDLARWSGRFRQVAPMGNCWCKK
jgi:hypothetical protein